MSVWVGVIFVAAGISGCAHLPDADVRYYLAKSDVSFKLVRAVTCVDDFVLIADGLTPSVTHTADRSELATKAISLSRMKGAFSDSDVKIEYYDDGRLRGFNGASSGQGEAALKTVVAIVGAALAFDGDAPRQHPAECAAIKRIGGDKPLVLTYNLNLNIEKPAAGGGSQSTKQALNTALQAFSPEAVTHVIVEANSLTPAIGEACARITGISTPAPRVSYEAKAGDILLSVREPALLKVVVTAGSEQDCTREKVWEGDLAVAQLGTPYELPIPPARTFGKRALAVAFAESGTISSLQLISNSGAGQALNVASAVQTATDGDTAAEKAGKLKAEADLIAQQQRLVACLADPKSCK